MCMHSHVCIRIPAHSYMSVCVCTHVQANWLKFAYFTGQQAVSLSRAKEFPNLNLLNQAECPLVGK